MCISQFAGWKMKKRTNIVLDEDLIEAGLTATGLKTRKELVDFALLDLLRREAQKKILGLKGMVQWEGDLSEMRKKRTFT
jgi:Arc/MetJ family transcription regulator